MITSGILYIIYGLVYAITSPLRAFADVTMPEGITNAIAGAGHFLGAVDNFIPVSVFVTTLGLVLVIDGAIFGYKMIMWLIRRLPTQS